MRLPLFAVQNKKTVFWTSKKACSTSNSQAVTHLSTKLAWCCFGVRKGTSVFNMVCRRHFAYLNSRLYACSTTMFLGHGLISWTNRNWFYENVGNIVIYLWWLLITPWNTTLMNWLIFCPIYGKNYIFGWRSNPMHASCGYYAWVAFINGFIVSFYCL